MVYLAAITINNSGRLDLRTSLTWNKGAVMALVGWKWSGRTPKKPQKVAPTQEIALFLHSSTMTAAFLKKDIFLRSLCFDTRKSGPSKTKTFFGQSICLFVSEHYKVPPIFLAPGPLFVGLSLKRIQHTIWYYYLIFFIKVIFWKHKS